MAEPKKGTIQNSQNSFADDLDSMLNIDEIPEQQVGLVDDDDAIDRLLIDDAFQESQDDIAEQSNDIDQLLADDAEFDEFGDDIDDLLANIKPDPKQNKAVESENMPAVETASIDDPVDLSALETVGEIEDLDDEKLLELDVALDPDQINDDLENMTEIDEFSAESENNNADFLLADFDISADEDGGLEVSPEDFDPIEPEAALEPQAVIIEPVTEDEAILPQQELDLEDEQTPDISLETTVDEVLEPIESEPDVAELDNQKVTSASDSEQDKFAAEQLAALAVVTGKIDELLKQQAQIKRDIEQKANKDELNSCLDTIDTLQTEQKKSKRNLEAVNTKKPVTAYVAIGIAVLAMIVGGSMGYQGYVAKSQINQLIEIMDKFQAQLAMAPGAAAEEKEMLRNRLDELARVSSANSEQLAELNKTLLDNGSTESSGDSGKPSADLMQIGAAIEALQNKVSALENNKPKVVAKPVPKKPVVVKDNWVVNLVAFKQDWYAKRKADEFAAKGVSAKVSKTESKGETWYRLSVDGFSSQYEAAAYAARVKKTLNLDSVWLNKTKK
ncbi:MAG: SPOR domain-containing protein [Methylomonas lenta]|nr:SPOR domain-containing protein [Methylomonas lenta]